MYDLDTQHDLITDNVAGIRAEEDMLYFGSETWLLAAPAPAPTLVKPETAEFLQEFFRVRDHRVADMMVLTASTKTLSRSGGTGDEFQFQPAGGFRPVSLYSPNAHGTMLSSPRVQLEEASASLFGPDCVDLTAMWEAGDVRPLYDKDVRLQDRKATGYVFRFPSSYGYERLVHVEGGPWRALHKMGLRARVPRDVTVSHIPRVGLIHRDGPDTMFGVLLQTNPPVPLNADSGLPLVYGAVSCSWATDDFLHEQLRSLADLSTRDPVLLTLDDILRATAKGQRPSSMALRFRGVVDVLRWRGVSEAAIGAWLEHELPAAYQEQADRNVARLAALADGRIQHLASPGGEHAYILETVRQAAAELDAWADWHPYGAGQHVCHHAAIAIRSRLEEVLHTNSIARATKAGQ